MRPLPLIHPELHWWQFNKLLPISRASGTACVHTGSGVWQEVWICSRETYFMPHYLKTRKSFWTFIAVPCFRGTAMGLSQSAPELLGKTYLASEDEWVTKLRGRRLLKPQGIVSLSYLNSHKLFSSCWSVWGPKFIVCVYLTQLKSQGKKTWKRKKKEEIGKSSRCPNCC